MKDRSDDPLHHGATPGVEFQIEGDEFQIEGDEFQIYDEEI